MGDRLHHMSVGRRDLANCLTLCTYPIASGSERSLEVRAKREMRITVAYI